MGEARVMRADRSQLRWDMVDLEGLLAGGHRARAVRDFVEGLDFGQLYAAVKSREGGAPRRISRRRVKEPHAKDEAGKKEPKASSSRSR